MRSPGGTSGGTTPLFLSRPDSDARRSAVLSSLTMVCRYRHIFASVVVTIALLLPACGSIPPASTRPPDRPLPAPTPPPTDRELAVIAMDSNASYLERSRAIDRIDDPVVLAEVAGKVYDESGAWGKDALDRIADPDVIEAFAMGQYGANEEGRAVAIRRFSGSRRTRSATADSIAEWLGMRWAQSTVT